MSLLSRKTAKPVPAACAPRSKVLVALCALFTIAVPLAIIAAVILPHMGDSDANAATPDAAKPTPVAVTPAVPSATTPVPVSPTAPVSSTAK